MTNDPALESDRRYFKRRKNRKLRLRRPFPGELEPRPPLPKSFPCGYFVACLHDRAKIHKTLLPGPARCSGDVDTYPDEGIAFAISQFEWLPGVKKLLSIYLDIDEEEVGRVAAQLRDMHFQMRGGRAR